MDCFIFDERSNKFEIKNFLKHFYQFYFMVILLQEQYEFVILRRKITRSETDQTRLCLPSLTRTTANT